MTLQIPENRLYKLIPGRPSKPSGTPRKISTSRTKAETVGKVWDCAQGNRNLNMAETVCIRKSPGMEGDSWDGVWQGLRRAWWGFMGAPE